MRLNPWVLLIVVIVAIAVVVAVLAVPRSQTETPTVLLTSSESPSWTQDYCIPEGTVFTYAWAATGGTVESISVVSQNTGHVTLGTSEGTHANGSGRYYSAGTMEFQATNVTSSDAQIVFELQFTLDVSFLGGTPHFGPGAC
jgi:hypothetical protein